MKPFCLHCIRLRNNNAGRNKALPKLYHLSNLLELVRRWYGFGVAGSAGEKLRLNSSALPPRPLRVNPRQSAISFLPQFSNPKIHPNPLVEYIDLSTTACSGFCFVSCHPTLRLSAPTAVSTLEQTLQPFSISNSVNNPSNVHIALNNYPASGLGFFAFFNPGLRSRCSLHPGLVIWRPVRGLGCSLQNGSAQSFQNLRKCICCNPIYLIHRNCTMN